MEFTSFIVEAVLNGVQFPSAVAGRAGYSISDVASMDIKSLGVYIDTLEKQHSRVSRADRASGKEENKIAGLPASEVIQHFDTILQRKLNEKVRSEKAKKLKQIEDQLETLATPEEVKQKLLAQKQALLAE